MYEGGLVPLERGTTPALLRGRSLHDSVETNHVLCGGRAHHPRSVVIDKSNRTTVLIDSLLDEIRIEEKKQDG